MSASAARAGFARLPLFLKPVLRAGALTIIIGMVMAGTVMPPTATAATATAKRAAPLPTALAERLTRADSAFQMQNYPRVIELLQPILDNPRLEGRREYRDALQWLGAAQWLTESTDAARQVYTRLLRQWPQHRLDPTIYPEELLRFYDQRRADLIRLGVISGAGAVGPETGSRELLVREIEQPSMPAIGYFAPFGIGQFVNGERGKGTVIAVIQGISLMTMTAAWLGVEGLKTGETNLIAKSDEGQANLLRSVWWAGAALLAASYTYSVADGLVNRRTEVVVREHREHIDIEDLPAEATSLRWHVEPAAQGWGLGIGGRF